MSEAKRQELIDNGQLWPDGTRKERCPTCLRPFAQGEGLPSPGDSAVAGPEGVEVLTPETGE